MAIPPNAFLLLFIAPQPGQSNTKLMGGENILLTTLKLLLFFKGNPIVCVLHLPFSSGTTGTQLLSYFHETVKKLVR